MANEPAPRPIVENIPSIAGEISAIASASAPFIYFEGTPFFGAVPGLGKIALATSRQIAGIDGKVMIDHVIVAHLVGNLTAIESLRNACNSVLAKYEKPEGAGN